MSFSSLVTHGHFQSRDKDSSHAIRSAIARNPHATHKTHGSICYRMGVMCDQNYTLRE